MTSNTAYILVTAAYNEAEHIAKTIEAVARQTIRPVRWAIVSDGSTDATDDIVQRCAGAHSFIRFIRRDAGDRGFASQARALMAGYRHAQDVDHAFIGTLDADITFAPDYYETLMRALHEFPDLGLVGGGIYEPRSGDLVWCRCAPDSVPGAIQFLRREAFEQAGGLLSLRRGGHDAVLETTVRMNGWAVRSFPYIRVLHHRPCGACYGNKIRIGFNLGIREYAYGSHPLWELAKCVGRMKDRPYVLAGIGRWFGYCWAGLRREPRDLPDEVLRYMRSEQVRRLWNVLSTRN